MKYAIIGLTLLLFLAGVLSLRYYTVANASLAAEIARLEAELGKMVIRDAKRVHLVEVASPEVPPEVASSLWAIWQFRCYLPAGYDYMSVSGYGRVTSEGLYQEGGSGSSWGSPNAAPLHNLLTISIQKKQGRLEVYNSFGTGGGTTSWNRLNPDHIEQLVIQKLASSQQGARSFDQQTILPIVKVYDPKTAASKEIDGQTLTTYDGGLFILCPRSREAQLELLRNGQTPREFDPDSVAKAVTDE